MALTLATNSMIHGATINPDDLGADPTGVADSSAALQAAFDTHKTVVFSNGANYKVTSGLTINHNQLIDGNNAKLTFVGTFNGVTFGNTSSFIFRNMVIDASALIGTVLDLPNEVGGGTFWIEHVNISGGTIGLSMVSQYTAYITSCRFAYFTDYGVYLTGAGSQNTNSLWFTSCFFVNGGRSGLPVVFIKASGGMYFDKCTWQGNNANTIGMQVEAANGLYVTNSYVEEYGTLRWMWFFNGTIPNSLQFMAIRDNYVLMDGIPVVFGGNSSTSVQITGNTFQVTGASSGPAVQGMVTGFIPEVHSNMGSRQDIDDTFAPTLSFGGATVGVTYDIREGVLRNYGNYLEGGAHIKLTSKGTSTGDVTIDIPSVMLVDVVGQNIDRDVQTGIYSNMASITSIDGGYLDNSSIRLYNDGATATTALTNANFTNTSELYVRFKSRFKAISQ